jgi:Txe/YoeB family toxin of Txe-Axe toxin-antitoxin module
LNKKIRKVGQHLVDKNFENMSIDKAILAFENHKKLLDDISVPKDNVWDYHLVDLIGKYIGTETTTYLDTKQKASRDGLFYYNEPYSGDNHDYYSRDVNKAKRLIESCQSYIKNNGVYKAPSKKNNFLGDFDDKTLWVIIPIFTALVWGFGFFAGKYEEKFNSTSIPTISQPTEPTKQIPNLIQNIQREDSLSKKTNK